MSLYSVTPSPELTTTPIEVGRRIYTKQRIRSQKKKNTPKSAIPQKDKKINVKAADLQRIRLLRLK
jgi:hypothetical protein